MAIKTYKNNAWVDIKSVNNAQSVRVHNGTSWVDVWTSMKIMSVGNCTFTNGDIGISGDNKQFTFSKYEHAGDNRGSLSGSGYIEFVIEGEWTNPLVSFDWYGGMNYWNAEVTMSYGDVAGTVQLRAVNSSGSSTSSSTTNIGQSRSGAQSTYMYDGTVSHTFSGTIKKITLVVNAKSFTSTYYYGTVDIQIKNFKINGEQIGFTKDAEAYSKSVSDY